MYLLNQTLPVRSSMIRRTVRRRSLRAYRRAGASAPSVLGRSRPMRQSILRRRHAEDGEQFGGRDLSRAKIPHGRKNPDVQGWIVLEFRVGEVTRVKQEAHAAANPRDMAGTRQELAERIVRPVRQHGLVIE